MKRKEILLSLITISLLTTVWGADGDIIIKNNPKNNTINQYVAAIATTGQENHHTFDYSTSTTPINAFIVAANGGKNDVTMKGDPTVGDKVVPNMKNFDGTDVLEPKNWTIEKKTGTGPINNGKTGKQRYILPSNKTDTGAVTLGDKSWTGENKITFENTSIKGVNSDKVMFANQSMDTPNGMSDTTITFKGNNFLYEDGGKSHDDEKDAVHFYKNTYLIPGKPTANINSHTKIVSEAGSTLNMYVKSGPVKSRGIGVTQYKDVAFYKDKKYYINQTEMEFRGAVNIKIERGNQNRSEHYGVFGSNTTRKKDGIGEPEGSYNKINFYSDVKIDVKPVLDENGKQVAIGDAINIDGKYTHVGISGDGKVQIDGDIHVLNGGTIDLNLKNKDSYINGEIHIGKQKYGGDPDGDQSNPDNQPSGQNLFDENRDDPDPEKNTTKLTLNMSNGARWNATNTSKINDLAINNEAQITFGSNKRFINISTGTLKGNGTFHMYGDIVDNKADRLIIRKSSEGHHKITYEDNGSAKTKGKESLLLVEYKTGNKDDIKGDFTLKHGTTDQGAYEYVLTDPAGSKIVKIDPGHNFYLNPTGRLSSAGQAVDVLHNMMYQANLTTMGTLVQRLGEIHLEKELKTSNNFWVKHIEGKYRGDATSKRGRYENRYYGMQGGYDWKREKGRWNSYHGIEIGMMHSYGSMDELMGSLKLVQREIGMYSTWLNKENNKYVDVVGRIATYRGGFNMFSKSGSDISSNTMQTTSYLLSAEMGQRIYGKQTETRKYYIEPEAQLSYHFTGGYPMYMKNGMTSVTDDFRSLILRLGFRAGVDHIKTERANPYVKVMYERELLGDTTHTFNEVAVEKPSKRDSWFTYGFGFTYLSKDRTEQFYLEIQNTTRHKVKQSWQVNLGLRHTF